MKNVWNSLVMAIKVFFILAGLGALYAYAMFQGGFVSWFLFYSCIPFLLFAFLVAIYPLKFWKVERIVDQHINYETGDTVQVQIQISRKLPIPLYGVIITDHFSDDESKTLVFPLFKRKFSIAYEANELKRGELIFDRITIKTIDFLGLMKKEHTWNVETKLLVYPKRCPLNLFFLEKQVGEGKMARGFDRKRETMVPTGIREYQRGDRLSWVNWKMTARKSDLMSKEFEKTEEHQYVICIDRSNAIPPNEFEKIVLYTTSLMNELMKTGYPVGLLSFGEERTMISVKKVADVKKSMLYHFAVVKNDAKHCLVDILEKEKTRLPKKGTIVLATAGIDRKLLDWVRSEANVQRKMVVISSAEIDEQINRNQLSRQNILLKSMDEDIGFEAVEVRTV